MPITTTKRSRDGQKPITKIEIIKMTSRTKSHSIIDNYTTFKLKRGREGNNG